MVPESYNVYSCRFQNYGPLGIVQALFAGIVPASIEFNGEFGSMAIEIEDVTMTRILPSKFEAAETSVPQKMPQQLFSIGLVSAQASGKNK